MLRSPGRDGLALAALASCLCAGCGSASSDAEATADAAVDAALAHHTDHAGHSGGSGSAGEAGHEAASALPAADTQAGEQPAAAGRADATREVTIRFRAVVADRDFSCQAEYAALGSSKVTAKAADFRFYVQDLALVDAQGKAVAVELDTRQPWQTPDVALVDFEDMQGSCHGTPETNLVITGKVPDGVYTGVVFSNGVPEALNHLEQSTQPAPLDVTDLYWAWLSGYRFFVAELRQTDVGELDDDAGVVLPGTGLLHIGSTACRKDKGCVKPNRNRIALSDFDPDRDVIVADLAAVFADTDLQQNMQCHASDAFCEPMFERLGVSWDSGESLPDAQRVYRVAHDSSAKGSR